MLIGLLDGIEVVATAVDGLDAVEQALLHRPDVVVMDLRMPRLDGAQATARIRSELPHTQVLVLTTYADDDALFPALRAGARGYLTKDASAEEIEQALSALARGETHLAAQVQQRLVAATLRRERGTQGNRLDRGPTRRARPPARPRCSPSSPPACPTPTSPANSS